MVAGIALVTQVRMLRNNKSCTINHRRSCLHTFSSLWSQYSGGGVQLHAVGHVQGADGAILRHPDVRVSWLDISAYSQERYMYYGDIIFFKLYEYIERYCLLLLFNKYYVLQNNSNSESPTPSTLTQLFAHILLRLDLTFHNNKTFDTF